MVMLVLPAHKAHHTWRRARVSQGSSPHPRVFPSAHGPSLAQHVCSGAYQGRSTWRSEEACWQAGAPTSSARARPESIREGSRQRNIREHSRNIPEHSRIEHRDRSRCKINNEGIQRESSLGQGLHTRSPQKVFKEALRRSSSLRNEGSKTKEDLQQRVFLAVHGSAIEGGCCDSNRSVHARG